MKASTGSEPWREWLPDTVVECTRADGERLLALPDVCDMEAALDAMATCNTDADIPSLRAFVRLEKVLLLRLKLKSFALSTAAVKAYCQLLLRAVTAPSLTLAGIAKKVYRDYAEPPLAASTDLQRYIPKLSWLSSRRIAAYIRRSTLDLYDKEDGVDTWAWFEEQLRDHLLRTRASSEEAAGRVAGAGAEAGAAVVNKVVQHLLPRLNQTDEEEQPRKRQRVQVSVDPLTKEVKTSKVETRLHSREEFAVSCRSG